VVTVSQKQTTIDSAEKLLRDDEDSLQAIAGGDINRLCNLVSSYWKTVSYL
jgi:hypothetical protein